MGIIEQVSRYDDHVRAMRAEQRERSQQQIADSIRQLQLRGLADPKLDPDLAIAALGAMTQRFPELWLVEHTHEFDFDEAVEQLSRLFSNALGIVEVVPKKTRTRRPRRHQEIKELRMRVVVVGASSGLGRCIGIGLAAARRPGGAAGPPPRHARRRGEGGRRRARWRSPATSPIRPHARPRSPKPPRAWAASTRSSTPPASASCNRLTDIDAETWRRAFDTNVIGAALITAAAAPPPHRLGRSRRLPVLDQRLA